MGEEESEAAGKRNTFRLPGLSLDLEIGRADSRIQAIGAVRTDTGEGLSVARGGLSRALPGGWASSPTGRRFCSATT